MTFPASEFVDMMRETIVVSGQASIDKYGKPSYSAGTSYKCRLVGENRMIRDQEGREVLQTGRAIVWGVASVTPQSRLTLPDGTTPKVISVDTILDEDGNHHTVITYGQ